MSVQEDLEDHFLAPRCTAGLDGYVAFGCPQAVVEVQMI